MVENNNNNESMRVEMIVIFVEYEDNEQKYLWMKTPFPNILF